MITIEENIKNSIETIIVNKTKFENSTINQYDQNKDIFAIFLNDVQIAIKELGINYMKNSNEFLDAHQSFCKDFDLLISIKKQLEHGQTLGIYGNIASEILYPIIVWFVLLWPLLIRPTLEAISRGTPLPFM